MNISDIIDKINKIGEETKDKITPFQVLKKLKVAGPMQAYIWLNTGLRIK